MQHMGGAWCAYDGVHMLGVPAIMFADAVSSPELTCIWVCK